MIGTDWLRRKAAGAVRIGPGPLGNPAQSDLDRVVPLIIAAMDEQALRGRVAAIPVAPPDIGPQPAADFALRCNCTVIYSRCYYGH
jgi:hypothetical protein